MKTIIANFDPKKEETQNPFAMLDQMLIDNEYCMLNNKWELYKMWLNMKYKSEGFRLRFFIRHCQSEPEYERFISDLRDKKGRIKDIFWPWNKKIALKKYDEFISYMEAEYMAAIKETDANVKKIIGERNKLYDEFNDSSK